MAGTGDSATTMDSVRAMKYKPCRSIYDRYPGVPPGLQLLECIKRDYLVHRARKQPNQSRQPKQAKKESIHSDSEAFGDFSLRHRVI